MNYELRNRTHQILKHKQLYFEKACMNDLETILQLYKERSQWLKKIGRKEWKKYLEYNPKETFIKAIYNSNYFILKENNKIIAGFELSSNSKYWKDEKTPAYYIYKLVVKVNYKNIGGLIFEICKDIARYNNKDYLRLDCLKSNDKLNQIYNNHGFNFVKSGCEDNYNYSLRELKINK